MTSEAKYLDVATHQKTESRIRPM